MRSLITAFSAVSAFLSSLALSAQNIIDSTYLQKHYVKQEVMIAMRDGTRLFTVIYRPADTIRKHPVLMMRTPYSVAPYGERFSPRLYTTHWRNYIRRAYIIVMQDVRGRYMSEGEFEDVRPFLPEKKSPADIDEASDAYDTVDWLVKHVAGNNGSVGVFGISYPGFYATMAAVSGHPAVKAVSPQAPVTDWFMGDDFHHNGALAQMDAFGFYYSFGRPRPKPTTEHAKGFRFPEADNYSFHLKQGALKNYNGLMGDSVKFWNELMRHPDYDVWWQRRDARRACKDVKPAVLVVGGTFDAEDCYGAWNLYKAIETQSKATDNRLVMGPWYHGGWHRGEGAALGNVRFGARTSTYFQEQLEVPFFDYHLRKEGELSGLAEATVFFSGSNKWRQFNAWPPSETKSTTLYLHPSQKAVFEKPAGKNKFTAYTSDPGKPVPYTEDVHLHRTREYMSDDQRFASRRPDVLVFETAPLTEDLTLAGPVIADLKVALSTTDADLVVKIVDVFPDNFTYDSSYCCSVSKAGAVMGGYQMLVRGEIMRGKYRKSFSSPEPFVPGRIETVRFALPDVAHTFRKGHRLMVQVQSSWFPLFDRNPQQFTNIYECGDKDFVPCRVSIYHDAANMSSLVLPVLKE